MPNYKTNLNTLRIAKVLLDRARADRAEYEAEILDDYHHGYVPHCCPHGVNLWVDYDVICGPCEEDGPDWNYVSEASYALGRAASIVKLSSDRFDAIWNLTKLGASWQQVKDLTDWALEPITAYLPKEDNAQANA